MNKNRFDKRMLIWAILWSVMVFLLLIMRPSPEMSGVLLIPGLDKIAHIILFAVLALLWLCALIENPGKIEYLWVIVLVSVYSIFLECLQALPFTKRDFDIFDIIANIIGANVAASIFYIFKSKEND